jgi:hypothetical protein
MPRRRAMPGRLRRPEYLIPRRWSPICATAWSSFIEMPQVAPLHPATQRVKGGAVLTFLASLDGRYLKDIDPPR